MMLKRFLVSTFLIIYVFVTAAMPVLGHYDNASAKSASAAGEIKAASEKDQNSELNKEKGSAGSSESSEDSSGTSISKNDAADKQVQVEKPAEPSEDVSGNESGDSSNASSDNASGDNASGDLSKPSSKDAVTDDDEQDMNGNSEKVSSGNSGSDSDADSDEDKDLKKDSKKEKKVPFSSSKTSGAGVYVHASADAGVLPEGTTMHIFDVSSSRAENVADQVLSENVKSAQGVDISFRSAKGKEIEPDGDVKVSIKLAESLEGNDFSLIHVPDNGAAETMGTAMSSGANFTSDDFSLYVLAGTGTEEDPFSNVYREYTIGFGEKISIFSDEMNDDGTWIPGELDPAWHVVGVTGGTVDQLVSLDRYKGTADVQPRLNVTAKNREGTIRVAFRYMHPVDKTHKTVTGKFVATHYYLIHIVNKTNGSYTVQFKNNDGTGVSHVSDLSYSTEEGVTAQYSVSGDYKHTFELSEDPSTPEGKVTLTMPKFPGDTPRTVDGKTCEFIGWSTFAKANPITGDFGSIVYPFTDAHVYAPGDKFVLDRDLTLWATYALKDGMKVKYFIRIDDHIPNEPQSHGDASYIQIGKDVQYTIPKASFRTDAVFGIDQDWDATKQQKPWPKKVHHDLRAAGVLPDDVTSVDEFKKRYRVVWSTLKKEDEGWHVDGVLYKKELFNLAYHENGDLVVTSSMPEGVKDISKEETTMIDKRVPDRHGMVFTGWNTKPDGTGKSFKPSDSVNVSSHPDLDESINTLHLYAQWAKDTKYSYQVRYLEAGTNKQLKEPVFYKNQVLGNKIYSIEESKKATSDIKGYVFSYAEPSIGSGDGGLIIGEDNSKNVITLYYLPFDQDILATALSFKKTDDKGNPLKGAEFELIKQGGDAKTVFTSDEQGNVSIPFTEDPGAGEDDVLTYTLTESKAPDKYIKSEDEYTIQIKRGEARVVTFPGSIKKTFFPLEMTVLKNGDNIDADNLTIENIPVPDPVALPIEAQKILEGRELSEGEFTFSITDAEGNKVAGAENAADGTVSFEGVEAKEAGTYEFTISEDPGTDADIQYDDSTYKVTAKVELGSDNVLMVSDITYEKNGETAESAVFTNKVIMTITYDLNGGVYNGDTNDIEERYAYGTWISIHEAPTRDGYRFLYWKGSEYQPRDDYQVVENHRFVAQWAPEVNDTDGPDDTDTDPKKDPNNNSDPKGKPNDGSKGDPKNNPNKGKSEAVRLSSAPQTSDTENLTMFFILIALSGASLIASAIRRKKN